MSSLALSRFLKLSKNGENAKFRGRPSVKLGKNGKNAKFDGRQSVKLGKNGKNAKFGKRLTEFFGGEQLTDDLLLYINGGGDLIGIPPQFAVKDNGEFRYFII